jgi:hypothetical protein
MVAAIHYARYGTAENESLSSCSVKSQIMCAKQGSAMSDLSRQSNALCWVTFSNMPSMKFGSELWRVLREAAPLRGHNSARDMVLALFQEVLSLNIAPDLLRAPLHIKVEVMAGGPNDPNESKGALLVFHPPSLQSIASHCRRSADDIAVQLLRDMSSEVALITGARPLFPHDLPRALETTAQPPQPAKRKSLAARILKYLRLR